MWAADTAVAGKLASSTLAVHANVRVRIVVFPASRVWVRAWVQVPAVAASTPVLPTTTINNSIINTRNLFMRVLLIGHSVLLTKVPNLFPLGFPTCTHLCPGVLLDPLKVLPHLRVSLDLSSNLSPGINMGKQIPTR